MDATQDNPATMSEGAGDEQTPAPTTTSQPTAPPSAPAGNGAASPTAAAAPAAPSPVSLVSSPNIAKPAKRGGLAGIMDELADTIAGTQGPGRVYKDSEGNEYIEHPQLSRKGQWLKIAGEAIHGAAAGAGAAPGPGQKGRAFAAGVGSTDKMNDDQRQQDQQQSQDVRQANQDHFNAIKLKHDMAAKEFELQRLKVTGSQQDVKFAQEQVDRERKLGSADLGIYKDEADLARVKEQNPNFWKDVYKNNIVAVPELGEGGERQGIHVFLRTPGIGSQLTDPGTPIQIFTPGKTPKDPPTLVDQVPTVPMTHDMVDAYNTSAQNKMRQWQMDNSELGLKAAEAKSANANAAKAPSEINKNNADANKANADADKAEKEGVTDPSLVQGIGSGAIAPERLGYILGKKEGQKLLADVKAAFPDLDTSKLESYPKLYADFTSGKSAQSLQNLNTALMHIEDLRGLNTYGSRIPGSESKHAFESKLTNASAEIANALAKPGATATKEEIAQVKNSLNPFLNRDSAITTQIHSMVEQYRSIRNKWINGAPSASYEAKIPDLSPESRAIIRKYAPEEAYGWWGHPVVLNGKVVGYSKDGKTMEPAGGTQ